jgi:dethiobiotin synthetase
MTGLFVTGTDTGVGKTRFSAGLLAAWHRSGRRVAPMKPVETGCEPPLHRAADAELLQAAAPGTWSSDDVCPLRYTDPVAPSVAARREGRPFDIDQVLFAAQRLRAQADAVVVEGAGGLLVPYSDAMTGADLIAALDLPLVVVSRAGLGTINHTALTLAEAHRRRLRVLGVVLNRTVPEVDSSEADNATEICRLTGTRILGVLPYLGEAAADLGALAAAVAAAIDVESLWSEITRPAGG